MHHCGAAYSIQNDRLHFYMRPPSRKRKRSGDLERTGHFLWNVSTKPQSHTITRYNGVFGLAVRGGKVYILQKTSSRGIMLYWEHRIRNMTKEGVRELCLLLHEYIVKCKLTKEGSDGKANISINEIRKNLACLQEAYKNSLKNKNK